MSTVNRKESYYLRPKMNGSASNKLKKNYDDIVKRILIKNQKEFYSENKISDDRNINFKNDHKVSHANQSDNYKAFSSLITISKPKSTNVPKSINKNFINFPNKPKTSSKEKKENIFSVNNYRSKLIENKSPCYSNKTIRVDLSSKKSPTNIISKELKIKNYIYKPKFVNLNLSPESEKSEKYYTNLNVQTDFYLETEISSSNNLKQSPDSKNDYYSLSKNLSNIKINVLNPRSIKIKKIDLNIARSLSKNRKYSLSSGDSNKAEKNNQEDFSSANFIMTENYNQERINNSLCDIVNNLQIFKQQKFGIRSVSPEHNLKKMPSPENPKISNRVITNINDKKNSNKNCRMLKVFRLKNKLLTNKTEIEK